MENNNFDNQNSFDNQETEESQGRRGKRGRKGRKRRGPNLFGVIICVLFLGFIGVRIGAMPLIAQMNPKTLDAENWDSMKEGEFVSINAELGTEAMFYTENRYRNVIPLGRSYFYAVCSEKEGKYVIIRASGDWYKKNFDDQFSGIGTPKKSGEVKGYVSTLDDTAKGMVPEVRSAMRMLGYEVVDDTIFIDLLSGFYGILALLCCVVGIVLCIVQYVMSKKGKSKVAVDILGVLSGLDILFGFYLILCTLV